MPGKKQPERRARRKHGTGSVHKRKDGRWQWSHMVNGRRITGYAEWWEEADRLVLADIALIKKHGGIPERLTVGEYLDRWFESRTDLRANTRYDWELIIRNRYESLRDIPLAELTRGPIQALVNQWTEEGLAPSTIKRVYFVPLRTAIVDAVRDDLISHNPCAYIRFPKAERIEDEEEEEQIVLSIEQAKRLLLQLDGHWLRVVVFVALLGLREGEVLALKWKDVDLEAGKLKVRRNVAQVPGKAPIEDLPKSTSSRRTLTIPDFVTPELRQHRIEQNEIRLKAGKAWKDLDLVFCQEDGTHIERRKPGEALEIALGHAGLPRITFHDLRKSAGSILLALGVPVTTVSRVLGHAHPGITLSAYAFMLPGSDDEAMDTYNEAWGSY